jgi:hypothetical protein
MNGNKLISFVVSLSNALLSAVEGHKRNQFVQYLPKNVGLKTQCNPTQLIKIGTGNVGFPALPVGANQLFIILPSKE